MSRTKKSEAEIGPSVLSFYLDDTIYANHLKEYKDLNEKLSLHYELESK